MALCGYYLKVLRAFCEVLNVVHTVEQELEFPFPLFNAALYLSKADSLLRDPLKKGAALRRLFKSSRNPRSNPGGRERNGADIYGNFTQILPPKKGRKRRYPRHFCRGYL